MWFIKNKKYTEKLVEFIINRILSSTVDRNILFSLFEKEITPFIGVEKTHDFFTLLNRIEKSSDRKNNNYWLSEAKKMKNKNIL